MPAQDVLAAFPDEYLNNEASLFYQEAPVDLHTWLGCISLTDIALSGSEPGEAYECPLPNQRGKFAHVGFQEGGLIISKFSGMRPLRQINTLWKLTQDGLVNFRINWAKSGSEDDVENYDVALIYVRGQVTNPSLDGGKALTSGDVSRLMTGMQVQAIAGYPLYRLNNNSRQTTTEDQLGNGIAFWPKVDTGVLRRKTGEDGVVTADADVAAEANVLYTLDFGSTWTSTTAQPLTGGTFENCGWPICVDLPQSNQRRILVFATETRAANNPICCYTDDLGATAWTELEMASGNAAYDAEFITAARKIRDSLFLAGTDQGTVFYSKDKGINWSIASYPGTNDVRGFARGPDGRIWAVGDGNDFYYSDDDGVTWTAATVALTGDGGGVAVNYAGWVFVIDGTDLKYSDDRGATLTTVTLPGTTTAIKSVQFDVWGYTGVLIHDDADGNDKILRTENGGLSWLEQTTGTSNTGYNDCVMPDGDPNRVHIVGDVVTTTWIELLNASGH
jgi:photosystem II stability/assembly factor-like uncharacterized protein